MTAPLAIVGPTASGKSALAMHLATEQPGAELISIDSMQVYRGMDIGTAKPTAAERAAVSHHMVDIVDPTEDHTVSLFQRQARDAMADVTARGGRPVLVGGTGLYHRAVIDDLDIPGQYPQTRADLDADPDTAALHRRLAELDPVAAGRMEPTNRRRVLRALEVTLGAGRPFSSFGPGLDRYPPSDVTQVGLRLPRPILDARIETRYRQQMADGFLAEVRSLRHQGLSRTASQALGYRELLAHLDGEMPLDEALDTAITRTRRFARRQLRWFGRDPRVVWIDVDDPADAWPSLERILARRESGAAAAVGVRD